MDDNIVNGIYYDGKSSRQYQVEVILNIGFLSIKSRGKDTEVDEKWEINKINNIDFSGAKSLHLHYGNFPQQNLIIENLEDFETIKYHYPELLKQNLYHSVLKDNTIKVILLSLIGLVALLVIYMRYIGPFVAERVVSIIPIKEEIVLGEKMFEPIIKYSNFDKHKSKELNSFYKTLDFESKYPIELYFADEDVVNAYAIPGGKIVVYRGLIDKMDSWEQLAGLIAHELAHVEKRHSLKALSKNLSTYFVISVITTDISGITSVFIENAFKLEDLSNSRTFEQEADDVGFEFLKKSNIDPIGMSELFYIINEEEPKILSKENKKILKWVSTHPLTVDRIANLQKQIKVMPDKDYPDNIEAEQFFQKLK